MDIESLKKLVNDWYSKQGVTDGWKVVITIDVGGCEVTTEPTMLLKSFFTKEKFKKAGVKWHGYMSGLIYYIEKEYAEFEKSTVAEFIEFNTEDRLKRMPCVGKKTVANIQQVLSYFGFPPLSKE